MSIIISIAFAFSGSLIAGIALQQICKLIKPELVSQYRPCEGGWWEAELNQCGIGLVRVPQQPVNTYTNVAYLTGGLFLMFEINTLPTFIFFITTLYLCVGSCLYHATSTRWAGSLDISAMYALFSSLALYAASTLINLEESLVALLMFVVGVLIGWLLRYKYKGNMILKIGIFIVLIYSFLIWSMLHHSISLLNVYLISSFALYLVAFIFWILDKKRIFPIKRWGHGLWHILTAIAISMLFYAIYTIK